MKSAIPPSERCARSRCPRRAVVIPGQSVRLCLKHEASRGGSRYGVKKAVSGARSYASKWEAERGAELLLLESQGFVRNLRFQVWFHLVVNGHKIESYIADAVFVDVRTGKETIEDSKAGLITDTYRRKRKWMAALGTPITEHHKPRKR